MDKRKKKSLFLSIIFIFTLFFSILFVVEKGHHHCIGEHCSVCASAKEVNRVKKELGTTLPLSDIFLIKALFLSLTLLLYTAFFVFPFSLISEKTRLNH